MKTQQLNFHILCECCSSPTTEEIATKRGYALRKCPNCELIFVYPQPSSEELNFIYSKSQGYFGTAATDLTNTSAESALYLKDLLKAHNSHTGTLLDIGCSTGKLIFHMQKLGWTVAGCDVNAEAVDIAINNGLNAQVGTVEAINYAPESFDVINMGDVIEHVSSPSKTLQSAYHLLKPNGIIVIRTPNAQSGFSLSTLFLSRMTGFPWAHSEAPYHLFEFTPKSMQELVKKVGFLPAEIMTSGKVPFLYTVGVLDFLMT